MRCLIQAHPPRMVTVQRERKWRREAGVDRRLEVEVLPPSPLLEATLPAPAPLLAGEVRCLTLTLANTGAVGLDTLHLVCLVRGLNSPLTPHPSPAPPLNPQSYVEKNPHNVCLAV